MSKDDFVDKYPYLVYTGENDMSTDDISGGGGGGGGVLSVTAAFDENENTVVLDKTYAEIETALSSGIVTITLDAMEAWEYFSLSHVVDTRYQNSHYIVATGGQDTYSCSEKTDYPYFSLD